MKEKIKAGLADTKLLFRSIPAPAAALFTISVVAMNILANKTIYQSDWLAIDGGILVSWLSFLCMDIVTKAFGPKAATKLSVFAMLVNLIVCLIFFIVSIIPTEEDYTAFNTIIGGTWFILLSSSVAFISSAAINNFMNWGIGRLFKKNPDGKLAYVTRSYISTFIGQFFDNLIFAVLTFMLFAPIFWDGFHWTFVQCVTCSLLGAGLELVMEVIFSPIGYVVLNQWNRDGVGAEYKRMRKI
jgi:uncharacterized integral membrane protein (TIGR00697 family)